MLFHHANNSLIRVLILVYVCLKNHVVTANVLVLRWKGKDCQSVQNVYDSVPRPASEAITITGKLALLPNTKIITAKIISEKF